MNMTMPLALVGYIEPWWMVIIKSIVFALIGLQLVPVVLMMERKILGRFQNRYGPNRVGLYGAMTPISDIIKLLSKEPFRPKTAIGWLFTLAPILSITAAVGAFGEFLLPRRHVPSAANGDDDRGLGHGLLRARRSARATHPGRERHSAAA